MENTEYNLAGYTEYSVEKLSKMTLERVRKAVKNPRMRKKLEKKKAELRERGIIK